jgi:hypothetical protein
MAYKMNQQNSDFQSVGPLRYLLIDHNGHSALGLYEYRKTGAMVLIGQIWGREVVYWPQEEDLNECLEEKLTLCRLLEKSSKTLLNLKSLNMFQKAGICIHNRVFYHAPIGRQKYHITHPNYYYLYKEFLFNQEIAVRRVGCK